MAFMYKNLKTAFGENLKYLRKSKGLTQERLAEILGISHRQLSRIEAGDNFPSVETLEKISLYLETELKVLFDFEWDKKYAVLSNGTDERPVFEVSLNDTVINLANYTKRFTQKQADSFSDCENIENSDKSMLNSAKNIKSLSISRGFLMRNSEISFGSSHIQVEVLNSEAT